MSLTVPTAGSIAGRSASIRVEAPETGGILAQFGNALAAKAGEWKEEQIGRQRRQTALDITRDIGLARQDIEANVSDPAQIGPTFEARVAEIRQKYITDDMDPKLAEDLGLTFQELNDRHALALGNRVIGLTQSQREADWVATRSRISAEAVNADNETFGAYVELGEAAIDERLARNVISPEQAAIEKDAFRREVYGNRADALIASDPAAFLDAAKAGEWNILGEDLATRQKVATSALAEAQVKAAKDEEAALKERETEIGRRLGEIASIASAGRTAADEAFLSTPEVKAHPKFAEAAAAIELRDETPGLKTMTVPQLDQLIAAEEKKPITAEYQNERLKLLRTWRDQAAAKQETDTVGWATSAGLAVPELPDFDPADPQGFVAGLSRRLAFDETMRSQGYTKGQAVFSAAELAEIKAAIDPKADPETRIGVARAFTALGDREASYLATVTGADPAFVRATRLMVTTGSEGVAREILRGQQRIETGTVVMPSSPDLTRIFDEVTGGAFNGSPIQKAEIIAAASALYADQATTLDPADADTPFKDDGDKIALFETAMQRVLGAVPDENGQYTIGGLQEVNGGLVPLPVGIAAQSVAEAFDNIGQQLDGYSRKTRAEAYADVNDFMFQQKFGGPDAMVWVQDDAADEATRMRAFKAASITGMLPDLGTDPAGRLADLQLRRVGESDVYELVYEADNGRIYTIPQKGDDRRRAFRFRIADLIRGAQQ